MSTGIIDNRYTGNSYLWADADVRSFGAVGDGSADDTAAFEQAISFVAKKGGGTVYAPAGRYVLSRPLSLPCCVSVSGELIPGTADGTILCITHGKGTEDRAQSAFRLDHQSAVRNLAVWYPGQTMENGEAVPYPPTVTQIGSESVTVQNVTFVNAWYAICYAAGGNNSLQYTRDVYGTPLFIGYENDRSYDIGKIENLRFSPDYWLNAGLPGTPDARTLRVWLKEHATGILLERIDWTYLADVTVDGYGIGVRTRNAGDGAPNGHIYRFELTNCVTCLQCDQLSWLAASDCRFTACETAIRVGGDCAGDLLLHHCVLTAGTGVAIRTAGKSKFSLTDCSVFGGKAAFLRDGDEPFDARTSVTCVNSVVSDRTLSPVRVEKTPTFDRSVPYGKDVVTKPASSRFIDLSLAPYFAVSGTDITPILRRALNDLRGEGGTLYLPAGGYVVSGPIDVWEGIELRGAVSWPQSFSATCIRTEFGKEDPEGEALVTLHRGAGIRGIGFLYPAQDTKDLRPYSYTVRGAGEDVYLVDVAMTSGWNGVDFASHRCDRHYVEFLWGAFANNAIRVGAGSEDGIIRDCHFTPNCWSLRAHDSFWGDVFFGYIQKYFRTFVIGESRREILYHNFTYGASEGLSLLSGAKDVFVLCHGVDAGDWSVCLDGDCTASLVDCQLVNLHASRLRYVRTNEGFTGSADFINGAFWGPTRGAFDLNGKGEIGILGGEVVNAGEPLVHANGDRLTMVGLIDRTSSLDFLVTENALPIFQRENLFEGGLTVRGSEKAFI